MSKLTEILLLKYFMIYQMSFEIFKIFELIELIILTLREPTKLHPYYNALPKFAKIRG